MTCWWLEPKGNAVDTLTRHLPMGVAWEAFRIPGKVARRLIEGYAAGYDDMSEALCRLVGEIDPRTTTDLVEEWERALSLPDACLPPADTLEKRRERILFRLAKRRWTTAQDWHDLAALFGLQIRITPGWLIQKPALYAHHYPKRYDLFPKLGRFRVYIDVLNGEFGGYDYGAADRGDGYPVPYGSGNAEYELFKCMIERVKPANVVVIWDAVPVTVAPETMSFAAATLSGRNGMAIDFQDLSMVVRDAGQMNNNFYGNPNAKLVYTAPSVKWIRNAAGVLVSGTTLRTEHAVGGAPIGLRHEAAATNNILWSQAFDNAWWTKSNSTVTASTEVAPDGTTGAFRLEDSNTNTSSHNVQRSNFVSFTGGVVHTLSAYVKPNARSTALLAFGPSAGTGTRVFAVFDLAAKTVTSSGVSGTGWTFSAAGIEDAGNGWCRVWLAGSATATTTGGCNITPNSALSYAGVVGSGVHVWQAQLEAGSRPSSPIVTAGATVTRAADDLKFAQAAFPWNGGTGLYDIDGVTSTPATSGADLVIAPRSGQTHIRNLLWLP